MLNGIVEMLSKEVGRGLRLIEDFEEIIKAPRGESSRIISVKCSKRV